MAKLREIAGGEAECHDCGAPAVFEYTHKWERRPLCRECMLEMRLRLIKDIYKELEAEDE